MEGETESSFKVLLIILASLLYCYFISNKLPNGKLRLFSLLPIFYLFTILPLQLTSVLPTGIIALTITWLCNFKLLLFAFDQGPLSSDQNPPLSLVPFISIACLPVKIKQYQKYPSHQNHISHHKSPTLPLNWPTKVVLYAALVGVHGYLKRMHPKTVMIVCGILLYLLLDIIFGMCNGLVRSILGIEFEPPSDEPYCSTSLQDFWGRRWNLMVTNILRHTVYKPVRVFSEYLLGKQWAPFLAVLSTFVVSGLMHELIFYQVTRATPTWEVTCFFVLHGICLVVELVVKRLFRDRCRLPWTVSGPFTVGFVLLTATWLFFPPVIRTGADVRAIEESKMLINFVKERLQVLKEQITCLN